MRFRRHLLLCAVAFAAALPAAAEARVDAGRLAAPAGLKAFLLRAEEPARHEFSRTPSFAWKPVAGAVRYEFELATSRRFASNSVVWTNVGDELPESAVAPGAPAPAPTPAEPKPSGTLRTPTIAIDLALPWITGSPYALYARVRAITSTGPTPWSTPFGFNIRWGSIPQDLDSPYPGLVRWSPVEGATSYEVWLHGARWTFHTTTNVADARELYTFHRTPEWTSTISFRVRARRTLYGEVANGLPTSTYGPWSPLYSDPQLPLSIGALRGTASLADSVNTSDTGSAHGLTPGFAFAGDRGGPSDYAAGAPVELYRVYIATDRDCVNIVYRGAIVGSPAYAPRLSGPLALPQNDQDLARARTKALDFGSEGSAFMVDGTPALSTEATTPAASGSTSGPGAEKAAPKVDLPDTAWPAGGYYWTVVPVHAVPRPSDTPATGGSGTATPSVPIEYRESELPQDACQAGRVMRFGKTSPTVVARSSRPFASGLSPAGRLVSAARSTPSFYGSPLVAWQPALGAQQYEVQWSRTGNPFKPVGNVLTAATSAMLPLEPGTWYYRIRGFNYGLPKRAQLAWSAPVRIKVAKPVFKVVKPVKR